MKYFKDTKTNEVYAYKTEAERQEWGAPDLVKMTPEEVDAHINPQPSPEQLAEQADKDRTAAMLQGIEYNGVMCSATKEDMWGLASISNWIQAGNTTLFVFDNGSTLQLTHENYNSFYATWAAFRASFF